MHRALSSRARSAAAAHAAGAEDRHLERTLASRPGLRVLLAAAARRFDPAGAAGFAGTLRFELTTTGGQMRAWAIVVAGERAVVRSASLEGEAALIVRASGADFVRLATGALPPARALLSGRLDVAGDFSVARRLGPMFGIDNVL